MVMNIVVMTETSNKNESENKEQLKYRPLWQRLVYPIVGLFLIALGLIGWIIPIIPGFPLIIIGFPLLFCFHPRIEAFVRVKMKQLGHFLWDKIKGLIKKS